MEGFLEEVGLSLTRRDGKGFILYEYGCYHSLEVQT